MTASFERKLSMQVPDASVQADSTQPFPRRLAGGNGCAVTSLPRTMAFTLRAPPNSWYLSSPLLFSQTPQQVKSVSLHHLDEKNDQQGHLPFPIHDPLPRVLLQNT